MSLKSSVQKGSMFRSSMSIIDLKGISFKVIVIGQSSVGKSSLIHKYIHGQFLKDYNITVGVDFKSKTVQLEDKFVQLQIWDTCGQQIYRSVVSSFYRGAAAVFFVYSVNDKKSFDNLKSWNQNFDKEGSAYALKFLIGTKSDLQRQVSIEQAKQYMKQIQGSFFIQTSSFTGQNIDQLFKKAADALYKNYQGSQNFRRLVKPQSESVINMGSIRLENPNQISEPIKKKKKCC